MDTDDFFIPQFSLASFQPSPILPRHTCGLFTSRHVAHQLKITAIRCQEGGAYLNRGHGQSANPNSFPELENSCDN
jgi:hypothetical protein